MSETDDPKNSKNSLKKNSKENSRFCLLHSASKLFAKIGFDKTSTRDIASDAQVNISMISYHFGGKEGLYNQVLVDFANNISIRAEDIFQEANHVEMNSKNFLKIMSNIVDNIIQTRILNPEICTLLAREKIEGLKQTREVHEKMFSPLVNKFLNIIDLAQKNNVVKKDLNPLVFFTVLSEGIWGLFEVSNCKLSHFESLEKITKDPVILRNQIIKIYLEGIMCEK